MTDLEQISTENYMTLMARRLHNRLRPEQIPHYSGTQFVYSLALVVLLKGRSANYEDVHNAMTFWSVFVEPRKPGIVPWDDDDRPGIIGDSPYLRAVLEVAEDIFWEASQ